jgi:hypothetical protein
MPPMIGVEIPDDLRGGSSGVNIADIVDEGVVGVDVEDAVPLPVTTIVIVAIVAVEVIVAVDDDNAPPSTCANLTISFSSLQQFLLDPQHHFSLFDSSAPLVQGVICEFPFGYRGLHILRQALDLMSGEVQKSTQYLQLRYQHDAKLVSFF